MTMIGLNFTKINAERNGNSENVKVESNVAITNVIDSKMSDPKKSIIKFHFNFTSKYQPNLGLIELNGELIVKEILNKYFIVRTSWVVGSNGNNFVKTMLKLGKEKDTLNVVCDQIGSPTFTKDLSVLLCDMTETQEYGTYHATNEGFCSWAEFAEAIMSIADLKCKINYIKTSEYKTKAVRPLNSRLSKKSIINRGFMNLPEWDKSLIEFITYVI